MDAGALIAQARTRAGITQSELAARMGTHQSVVARWERGKTQPTLETVTRAVAAAGLELEISLSDGPLRSRIEPSPDANLLAELRRLHAEQSTLRWIKGR